MSKKTYLLLTILTFFVFGNIFSQNRKSSRQKIKALKVSYITEKLNLSETEAAKFWPIYNEFEKKRYKLYHTKRGALKKKIHELGGIDNLTEKDAKEFAKKMLSLEKQDYEAHVDFQSKLSKVISYKKIVKLQIVERDFNRRLFRRYKNQKTRKTKKGNK